ncbi:MAG: hypothetical protein ACLTEK_00980 [Christensenellales bacterium]
MTYIPRTGRRCAKKKFYVFFRVKSEYEGMYATVEASSLEKAYAEASKAYGYHRIGRLERDADYAAGKIKAYGLKELEICTK